uniref:Activator of basal transcription 1 n=1 Tax=Taeniopygia guttata TaxID=59729 RepID=A0A674HAY6_TAEGU
MAGAERDPHRRGEEEEEEEEEEEKEEEEEEKEEEEKEEEEEGPETPSDPPPQSRWYRGSFICPSSPRASGPARPGRCCGRTGSWAGSSSSPAVSRGVPGGLGGGQGPPQSPSNGGMGGSPQTPCRSRIGGSGPLPAPLTPTERWWWGGGFSTLGWGAQLSRGGLPTLSQRRFPVPAGGSVRRRRQRPGGPPAVAFAEGWVEFRDKRAAKRAAKILHGAPMAPRPRSPFRHHCWSIKYLPGFRWPHLSERLSYERQVRAQRLRAEVAQAKREGGFYTRQASKAPPKTSGDPSAPLPTWGFTQRPTEEEIWRRKARPPPAAPPMRLLEKVFGAGR